MASLASARNSSSERSSSEVPTTRIFGASFGLHEVGHTGQQFAFGQVAGGAEQHDDVRGQRLAVLAPGTRTG